MIVYEIFTVGTRVKKRMTLYQVALYEAVLLLARRLMGFRLFVYPAVYNMLKSEKELNRLYCFSLKE